jgi:hypothetical protein
MMFVSFLNQSQLSSKLEASENTGEPEKTRATATAIFNFKFN